MTAIVEIFAHDFWAAALVSGAALASIASLVVIAIESIKGGNK
jgi:hypothetical protein